MKEDSESQYYAVLCFTLWLKASKVFNQVITERRLELKLKVLLWSRDEKELWVLLKS